MDGNEDFVMRNKFNEFFMSGIGGALVGMAVSLFFVPSKIVSGGVSGVSTILFYLFGIKPSVTMLIVNVVLLILGLKYLGKEFILKTIVGIVALSVSTELFSLFPAPTDNIFLASVFGSVIYGFGLAVSFCNKGSTGGTDIAGRLLQILMPNIKVGKAIFIVDGLIIAFSLFVFKNIDITLFGVIALFIVTSVTDFVILNMNLSKLVFVVTDKGAEVSDLLISNSPRGITQIKGTGRYTNTQKDVLMCALKSKEIKEFQERVLSVDKDAFVIFAEAQQILGNGFRIYS